MPFLTIFSRQGGKNLLRKRIIKYFPSHVGVYVEPFVGAGNLFFQMKKLPCFSCEVINDLDKDVYHIFKDVQKVSLSDIKNMDFDGSPQTFEYYKTHQLKNPVERLNRNLYLNYWSFGGKNTNYHPLRGQETNRKKTLMQKLDCLKKRLKGVVVLNKDYKKVIHDYDSVDTFFYLDPPYHEVDVGGYKNKTVDPQELYNAIKDIKGKFLLSYNDHPDVVRIFKGFHVKKIKTKYTINSKLNHLVGHELLISNYPLREVSHPEPSCSSEE